MKKQIQMVSLFRDSNGMRIGTVSSEIEGNKIKANNIRENYVLTDPEDIQKAEAVLALGQNLIENDA